MSRPLPQPGDAFDPSVYAEPRTIDGVQIQPTTVTEVKNIHSFRVFVAGLELFKSVTVIAVLQDENGNSMTSRTFTFEGAEYLAWNNDDQYLVNKVAERLGFTLTA